MPDMGRSIGGGERGTAVAGAPPASTWSGSGLEELTGRPDGPGLGPPPRLVPGVRSLATSIARDTARLGGTVHVDPLGVMAERARIAGLRRRGSVSCGGSARLLPCADDWMAVSLARTTDWELTAAWLGLATPVAAGDWSRVAAAVGRTGCGELLRRADGLGLPVARVGERRAPSAGSGTRSGAVHGVAVRRLSSGRPASDASELVVADLSTLWAGPLVGAVLARAGARVRKVESASRPDGARAGSPAHFASLDAGKETVVVDLLTPTGRRELRRIVDGADVVVTSARPRALEQLGLDPETSVRHGRPRAWLSITGYGTGPGSAERVAFGDDAAAAGGLVTWDGRGPCFCADAVADPVTGLAAAAVLLGALVTGGDHLLVASMADVAAGMACGPGTAPAAGNRSG